MLAWESFGQEWVTDATKQLKLDARVLAAPYGALPDLAQVDFARDVIFTWNGTTSGVRVPNADWIPATRAGLVLCDATSAVFAMDVAVVEARRRHLVAGRRCSAARRRTACSRCRRAPSRGSSRTRRRGRCRRSSGSRRRASSTRALFEGATINTPSMLCVEDALDGLAWAERVGGLRGLVARSEANLAAIAAWVARTPWVDFLARDPATRSCTSICLADRRSRGSPRSAPDARRRRSTTLVGAAREGRRRLRHRRRYRDAPPGLRIWGGATVERDDLEALLPWLDWAFAEIRT